MITVSVVDDDQMLLDGLAAWLANVAGLRLVHRATTVDGLAAEPERADVVLLDLVLRDRSDPVANVARLVEAGRRVLMVSCVAHLDQIRATMSAGANGYITKDNDLTALAEAIREVAAGRTVYSSELALALWRDGETGGPVLTGKERQLLLAYASGMTMAAAARRIGVQPSTAKTYLERIKEKYTRVGRPTYTKLDLANRTREDGLWRSAP